MFTDSRPWEMRSPPWDHEIIAETVSLTVAPWELRGLLSCAKSYWKVTASGYSYCEPHLGSHKWHSCDGKQILYSGKLSREKTFANFTVFWLFAKVFSTKFGGVVSLSMARVSNPRKFCPQKSYFSPICEKFSPWKVSRYMVHQLVLRWSVNFSKGKIVLFACYSV